MVYKKKKAERYLCGISKSQSICSAFSGEKMCCTTKAKKLCINVRLFRGALRVFLFVFLAYFESSECMARTPYSPDIMYLSQIKFFVKWFEQLPLLAKVYC